MARYGLGDIIIHKNWKSMYVITEVRDKFRMYLVRPISEHKENRRWKPEAYPSGIPVSFEEGIIYFELGA